MEDERIVLVTNRDSGAVGYEIADRGIRRHFTKGETKKIPFSEIQALQYVNGGDYALKHLLIVKDMEVLDALNIETEPEYFYEEDDIKKVLLEGSVDQLDDTLTFGTDGVKELVKKLAVELEVPDTRKRKLIQEKLGFNVDTAININHLLDDDNTEEAETEQQGKRKAAPINAAEAPTERKAAVPKYNIVSEG